MSAMSALLLLTHASMANDALNNPGNFANNPGRAAAAGSKGGKKIAHERGRAHEFSAEEARAAGLMSHKNDA
ncbi:hypothetical protein HY734_01290 [Candidatus Uhrbacteria bacterium]|nr:hypothetical protein [Candidatus Uhrbacteria bacterium]